MVYAPVLSFWSETKLFVDFQTNIIKNTLATKKQDLLGGLDILTLLNIKLAFFLLFVAFPTFGDFVNTCKKVYQKFFQIKKEVIIGKPDTTNVSIDPTTNLHVDPTRVGKGQMTHFIKTFKDMFLVEHNLKKYSDITLPNSERKLPIPTEADYIKAEEFIEANKDILLTTPSEQFHLDPVYDKVIYDAIMQGIKPEALYPLLIKALPQDPKMRTIAARIFDCHGMNTEILINQRGRHILEAIGRGDVDIQQLNKDQTIVAQRYVQRCNKEDAPLLDQAILSKVRRNEPNEPDQLFELTRSTPTDISRGARRFVPSEDIVRLASSYKLPEGTEPTNIDYDQLVSKIMESIF